MENNPQNIHIMESHLTSSWYAELFRILDRREWNSHDDRYHTHEWNASVCIYRIEADNPPTTLLHNGQY